MPYYDHNKDYPFAAFITNLGKYNEGELVGEWVKFPTTAEELKEVFKRIGIGQKDDFGQPYEEWFITDYDCYVDGLYSKLGEYENLDELNYLASKLDEMSESEYAQFQAGMEMGDHCGSLQEIINLTENLDCYEVYPDIHDYDDLGRYYIEELDVMQVPEHLQNYIDYEAYGRDVALEENGTFTDQGYVRDTGDSFHEHYDGERGSIPDEYRVMTFQDDLPEEEKSEWAMDIAFDMDEFFRQNDPQYAAEHPEAQAAKEELYENLMAGRISALDEKLAALGQTQEDYLPSEIEKFKDATGYEEFLDFDPAEVKAALDDPEKSHADEMLSAAEKVASEKMTVLVVEPMKEPYVKEIDPDLHSLQAEVGGDIGATYPYSDPVALVCNDEGKLIGLDLNRGLRDENGEIYDIVAGTFLVVGLGEEDFASLSPELIQKYTEQFKTPERFMQINGNIVVLPVPAEKQDLTYLPDRFETGERVQTPRGSFRVTAMSREQMEAAELAARQLESVKDQFVRLTAEYDNYRKRTAKEKDNLYQDAKADTIKEFLAVYDNLERAVATEGDEDSPHKKGLEMIFHQYQEILKKLGVTEIEAQGQPFDPEKHNAVMHIDDENLGENVVSQVFQAGFLLGDKVIRHAIVQVAN